VPTLGVTSVTVTGATSVKAVVPDQTGAASAIAVFGIITTAITNANAKIVDMIILFIFYLPLFFIV
jgi:hypothetical protein